MRFVSYPCGLQGGVQRITAACCEFRSAAEEDSVFAAPGMGGNCQRDEPFQRSRSVPQQLDFDGTFHKDRKLELPRREQRDQLVKDALQRGKTVRFAAQVIRWIRGCSAMILATMFWTCESARA